MHNLKRKGRVNKTTSQAKYPVGKKRHSSNTSKNQVGKQRKEKGEYSKAKLNFKEQ